MRDQSRVIVASPGSLHRGELSDVSSASVSGGFRPGILRGREAVAGMQALVTELALRTGQAGTLDGLDLLVHAPTAVIKTPHLVLVGLRAGVAPAEATANDVLGAVLIYEYRAAGIGSRIFATDDVTGERTVIAPAAIRAQIGEAACRILADYGALISLISIERTLRAENRPPLGSQVGVALHLATRTRTKLRDLVLKESLEATLASLGKSTRRNFRRYRTRVEQDFGETFLPSVAISLEEFLALNHSSTNPVTTEQAVWRYKYLSATTSPLFAGMRAPDGRWLSIIAGSRRNHVTQIEWQVNRADMPHYSLSTVMRSYVLEHEIALGTTCLVFKGGTPHSMGNSFLPVETLDIIAVRPTLVTRLLLRGARWIFPKWNFLGSALQSDDLTWIS